MFGQLAMLVSMIFAFIWIALLLIVFSEANRSRIIVPTLAIPPIVAPKTYLSLDGDVQARYRDQIRHDQLNVPFSPLLNGAHEVWPHGLLQLENMIHNNRQSSLYSILSDPHLLLKYEADCEEVGIDKMHPLLLDFWYGHAAFEVGVGAENLFISPPVVIDKSSAVVQWFTMSRRRLDKCVVDLGTVRYMVMRRIPTALTLFELQDQYRGKMVPFQLSMRIAISLILKLRELHTVANVVHGDIHSGNILVTPGPRVWIIDYGRSRANLPAKSKLPINEPFEWTSLSMSPWQIEGYEWSPRDDVYNAIRTLALMMNGDQYKEFETAMKKAGDRQILHWKKNGDIWFVPPGISVSNPVHALSINLYRKTLIKQSLGRILTYVRSLHDVDDVVDYARILKNLHFCLDLTDPSKYIRV